jgi:hypothetical protein
MPEDWDAKKFVERMLSGEGELPEMLVDLTPEPLAEIEVLLAERKAHRARVYSR